MKQTLARFGAAIVALALLDGAAAAEPDGGGRTPHAPAARIADLIGQIEADNPAAQVWAADSLAKLGPEARSAVPALMRAARKPPKRILGTGGGSSPSVAAARALWAVRPEAVMQVLQRDHRQSSLNVIAALGGTPGVRAVKALQLAMLDHCDEVRLAATRAMGHVGAVKRQVLPDAALRRLAKAAEDRDRRVREAAVEALARLSGGGGRPGAADTSIRGAVARTTKASTARFATLVRLMSSLAGSEPERQPAAVRSAGKPKDRNAAAARPGPGEAAQHDKPGRDLSRSRGSRPPGR
jgi:HEAT repeat protein